MLNSRWIIQYEDPMDGGQYETEAYTREEAEDIAAVLVDQEGYEKVKIIKERL